MTKKPLFWILLTISSVGGVLYFAKNFDSAFPALSVNVKMDREMAIYEAEKLSKKYNWTPTEYSKAVSFDGDRNLQTFVELEGGGLDTFKMLYSDNIFYPYVWRVRHFQEKNPNEVSVWFTPEGKPYSFSQKLSEDEPGSAISRKDAYDIAMGSLKDDWYVNLDQYELVDESEKVQPGGRVDHTFTYQLSGFQLGENGFIKLKLTVLGDRLGELVHYAQVPEAFNRRFSEMRSANDTIAFSATIIIYLLYGLLGVIVSIFFLMRTRWILWREAIGWGMIVGFFQVAVQLNFMPMMWMEYNTAISENNFMMEIMFSMLMLFIFQSTLYGLSFIAAEGLTRKAFPNHIQFWKVWSSKAGSSINVLGQTIGGYLITGVFMFYAIAFYTFVTKKLGWWAPADTSYDPNQLAAYFPWLTSIGISLGAGFWEECLFRAVPLAGAALVGDRFGKRNLFIGIAFVFQAIVFGAAHANYPVQPAYARVVELMIPSFLFGYIYLRFGLLPGIIMHYAYDVAMISLQLFTANVPGIYFQRFMVILFLLIPLWVVLYLRFQSGKWSLRLEGVKNFDWQVPPPPKDKEKTTLEEPAIVQKTFLNKKKLILFGIIGSFLWILFGIPQDKKPIMELSRSDALQIAQNSLSDFGFSPDSAWKMETRLNSGEQQMDRFIWQEYGKEAFSFLRGKYIYVPSWEVRYRKYFGDVAQRAEEYRCYVNNKGDEIGIWHQIPEDRECISLSEEDARSLTLNYVQNRYGEDASVLNELEANSFKKPNRLDWKFIFEDTTTYKLETGQLRLTVEISGDQIKGSYRNVFVPEDWKRLEKEKESRWFAVELILGLIMTFSLAYVIVFGTIHWSKNNFDTSLFLKALILLCLLGIVQLWSDLPLSFFNFKTEQPYTDQVYQTILMGMVGLLIASLLKAIMISSSKDMIVAGSRLKEKISLEDGILIGLFLSGGYSLVSNLIPSLGPQLGNYSPLNARIEIWDQIYTTLNSYANDVLGALSTVICINVISKNWKSRTFLGLSYIILIGFSIVSQNPGAFESGLVLIGCGLIVSAVLFVLYKELIRFSPELIPIIFSTTSIISTMIKGYQNIYAGQFLGAIASSILIAMLALFWYKLLRHQ
ncbi:MAG: CPBP family intramembrane glutamic endopeptidase [Candidatus Neomarinimicrobiota bacterium]